MSKPALEENAAYEQTGNSAKKFVAAMHRYPGQKKGERVEGLTQSTDIAPTILSVLGIPKPDWMEGQPLKAGALPAPAETMAINFDSNGGFVYYFSTKFAVWWDRYKLIAGKNDQNVFLS